MTRIIARPTTRRKAARWLHIIVGLALGAFIYMPSVYAEPMRLALQLVAVPSATITGIYLWKQAAIHRVLRRFGRRPR